MEYCSCKFSMASHACYSPEEKKKCSLCYLPMTNKIQFTWANPSTHKSWRKAEIADLVVNEKVIYQLESPGNMAQMWMLCPMVKDLETIYLEQRNGFLPMPFPAEFENNIEMGCDGVGYSFADEAKEAIRRSDMILKEYFALLNSESVGEPNSDSIRSIIRFDPGTQIEVFFDSVLDFWLFSPSVTGDSELDLNR